MSAGSGRFWANPRRYPAAGDILPPRWGGDGDDEEVQAISALALARRQQERESRRRLHGPKALDTSQQALVGAAAEVLEDVGARGGQIRLDGSIWSARSMDPSETFTRGEEVHVIDIDGPTAVVWKRE